MYLTSFRFAVMVMLVLLGVVLLFHFLVLLGIIPFDIVWGGKLQSVQQMLVFETVSVLLNALLFWLILAKANWVKWPLPRWVLHALLVSFTVLFVLNSIGNLLAEKTLETLLFTPITILFSLLCFRIVLQKQ